MDLSTGKANFKFQYLPDYANFLLNNKLDEFVTVGIRFCREADLPMMRPLNKMPEADLVALSRESNKSFLSALAVNDIVPLMEERITQFVENRMLDRKGKKLIDRSDILVEDIILSFYLRRKTFIYFLYTYTKNLVIHMLIVEELDYFTTHEHLATVKALMGS
ncbi:MAG: hypothetical protein K0S53_2708 [Bacteroidetes bacterium]|nr:hypothetical protein [Bacteroidota bacterium]